MILDGGLGLELAARGFTYQTRLWSGEAILERPELLVEIHRAYLEAGADVLSTATYQVSHAVLRELGYRDAAVIQSVFERAVLLAREAIAAFRFETGSTKVVHVAASLGPYGATVGDGSEYSDIMHLEPNALADFHAERLRAVMRAKPDFVMFETIPTRTEALVIAEVVRALGLNGVWLSLSCATGEQTFGGDRVSEIAAALNEFAGVAVIGVNCTAPELIDSLVTAIASTSNKPISICPNLGQAWAAGVRGLAGGRTEADFLRHVAGWSALGVAHIGGCCGIGPHVIRALGEAVAAISPHDQTPLMSAARCNDNGVGVEIEGGKNPVPTTPAWAVAPEELLRSHFP